MMIDSWGAAIPTCGKAGASPCSQGYRNVARDGPSGDLAPS